MPYYRVFTRVAEWEEGVTMYSVSVGTRENKRYRDIGGVGVGRKTSPNPELKNLKDKAKRLAQALNNGDHRS